MAALVVCGLLAATIACSSDSAVDTSANTVVIVPGADDQVQDCNGIRRTIDGLTTPAEVCVIGPLGDITLRAAGLEPGTTLTVIGSGGDTVVSEVGDDDAFEMVLGGKIVESSFAVRGTWLDGEALSITFDYSG